MTAQSSKLKIENAEALLELTIGALSNVLNQKDQDFLRQAMKSYAQHVIAEFIEAEHIASNGPDTGALPMVRL